VRILIKVRDKTGVWFIEVCEESILAVFKFRIGGRLRYLSHAETMRMFERALVRAGIEPVYSKGFNPHPRMSLPLPRPVGVAAEDDVFCVRVRGGSEVSDSAGFKSRLQGQLPEGCEVDSVKAVAGKVSLQPIGAKYIFKIKSEAVGHGLTQKNEEVRHGFTRINTDLKEEKKDYISIEEFKKKIEEILARERIEIERKIDERGRIKKIEVRGYIDSIEMKGTAIEVKCNISSAGSIRVDEIMRLLGLGTEMLELPIRRRDIRFEGLEKI
jgi:radical SAM-linked protein